MELMEVLPNGGVVLALAERAGTGGERERCGVVLCNLPSNPYHPYVTWAYATGNDEPMYTGSGDYFESLVPAYESFNDRSDRDVKRVASVRGSEFKYQVDGSLVQIFGKV